MTHLPRFVGAVAILASVAAAPAHAQTPTGSPQDKPDTRVDASEGGVTISSGVNSLTIGARAQFRWTVERREAFDGDASGSGRGREDPLSSGFDIPRLRITLGGGALKPWMRYSFQFEFSRTAGEGASKIKDAVLEIRPAGRTYRVSAGQFKVPFGLQQLTSSGRLLFVDRAITDAKFNPAREMGVMVSGTGAGRRFGYEIGVFNGSGESARQDSASHLWAGRAYVHPFGTYALTEGASDGAAAPVLHLGFGVRGGKAIRGRTTAGIVQDADNQTAWNAEFAYRHGRFSGTAEYFRMTDEQANPAALPDSRSTGYHAQAGYMLVPRAIEVGVLRADIDGDTDLPDSGVSETRAVFNYYWQGHNLKLQADAGRLAYGARFSSLPARARQGLPSLGTRLVGGEPLADTQLRVQLQLAF